MLQGGPGPYGVRTPRILIVDDDPNLLVILAEQLRSDGYDVQTARDGDEALRRLSLAWPDLLIIDMLMPRMDGLTLAREVKARADLPIIVLSAIDTADSKADLLDEVAEDYVTKPYHYPELGRGSSGSSGASAIAFPGSAWSLGPTWPSSCIAASRRWPASRSR
jgi:two-component system response regulator VicR